MGEDPTLMSKLVVQMVTGAQNNSVGQPYGPNGKSLRSGMCCKHFATYDLDNDRFRLDMQVEARDMWESFMPAFKACVQEAQATHVMCSCKCLLLMHAVISTQCHYQFSL
jgi:beta-glucosidase-like glycosyl hydrolase